MIANTIDEVIEQLEAIIQNSIDEESPLGYFAALYRNVTINVKNKLGQNYFDDDHRMEQLDVVFEIAIYKPMPITILIRASLNLGSGHL